MKRFLILLATLAPLGVGNCGCAGNGARDIAMLAVAGRFQGTGDIRTSGKPFSVGADTNWYIGAETVADFSGQWDFTNPSPEILEWLKGP